MPFSSMCSNYALYVHTDVYIQLSICFHECSNVPYALPTILDSDQLSSTGCLVNKGLLYLVAAVSKTDNMLCTGA